MYKSSTPAPSPQPFIRAAVALGHPGLQPGPTASAIRTPAEGPRFPPHSWEISRVTAVFNATRPHLAPRLRYVLVN